MATCHTMGHHPFDEYHQIAPRQASVGLESRRSTECATLENLGVEHQSARFPVKEPYTVTAAVDEYIDIAVERIAAHMLPYNTAKRMEALAQVCGIHPQPVTHAV